jgi:hypothetical protein
MIMVAKYPPSGQGVGGSKGEHAQQQHILGKHHAIPH